MNDLWSRIEAAAVAVGQGAVDVFGLGLDAAPALVLGLSIIAVLPLLIVAGVAARSLRRVRGRREAAVAVGASANAGDGDRSTIRMPFPQSGDGIGDEKGGATTQFAAKGYETARLVLIEGGDWDAGTPFEFGGAILVRVGREADNDIQILDPTVHRYHALIRRSVSEGYEIADLSDDSGNGVVVNGRRLAHARLADGDIIRLGKAELKFETEGTP